jgi:hypothetical protein
MHDSLDYLTFIFILLCEFVPVGQKVFIKAAAFQPTIAHFVRNSIGDPSGLNPWCGPEGHNEVQLKALAYSAFEAESC